MPSQVSEMRLPSKLRIRTLPPEEPNGSLFTKFTPGTRLIDWITLWPGDWVAIYSCVIVERDLAFFSAMIAPSMVALRWAVTTTSSTVWVPVD